MIDEKLSRVIKSKAKEIGFISCGISKADFLEEHAPRLESWLRQERNGKMAYMANHFDKRLDPRLLVDGAKSVISVLLNYYPQHDLNASRTYNISKYAFGEDYHHVLKEKLELLFKEIQIHRPHVTGRIFTDSAPVLEKAWAEKAGLGWIGKNANLITKQLGSFYFIGEIILDQTLTYDLPTNDHCGSCTKCIDACPTNAIIKPYVVDGSKCISYLTIELKDDLIPKEFEGKMDNWIFGCDICQDVCPWNRFSIATEVEAFSSGLNIQDHELEDLNQFVFDKLFKYSPIKRTKFSGLKRNIDFIRSTKKSPN